MSSLTGFTTAHLGLVVYMAFGGSYVGLISN